MTMNSIERLSDEQLLREFERVSAGLIHGHTEAERDRAMRDAKPVFVEAGARGTKFAELLKPLLRHPDDAVRLAASFLCARHAKDESISTLLAVMLKQMPAGSETWFDRMLTDEDFRKQRREQRLQLDQARRGRAGGGGVG